MMPRVAFARQSGLPACITVYSLKMVLSGGNGFRMDVALFVNFSSCVGGNRRCTLPTLLRLRGIFSTYATGFVSVTVVQWDCPPAVAGWCIVNCRARNSEESRFLN